MRQTDDSLPEKDGARRTNTGPGRVHQPTEEGSQFKLCIVHFWNFLCNIFWTTVDQIAESKTVGKGRPRYEGLCTQPFTPQAAHRVWTVSSDSSSEDRAFRGHLGAEHGTLLSDGLTCKRMPAENSSPSK